MIGRTVPVVEVKRLVALGYRPILIFGNDPSIDDIDFDQIKNSGIITAGVNRIWHKFEPDYLLFLDTEIQQELKNAPKLANTQAIVSAEYVTCSAQRYPLHLADVKNKFSRVYNVPNIPRQFKLFGSVPTLIHVLNEIIYTDKKNIFLVCGVSLKIDDIQTSHFWKGKVGTLNNKDKYWYSTRFDQQMESFTKIKSYIHHIYNCTPDSRLSSIYKSLQIEKYLSDESQSFYKTIKRRFRK